MAPLVKLLVNAPLFVSHGVRRHRVTFQLADGEAGEPSVRGRLKATAAYTGSASTLTCNLDVVSGSVSLIGSLPNCSEAMCAVDGIPSGMSHDCDRIAFLEPCHADCSDGYAPVAMATSCPTASGSLMCVYTEVAGDVVLEVGGPKCLSVVCSLNGPSTGISHECPDTLSQGSCVAPRPVECEADGNNSTTPLRCRSSVDFVSEAQTVHPSYPQMLGSALRWCEFNLRRRLNRRHVHGVLR